MKLRLAILGCAHIHISDAAAAIEEHTQARVTAVWDHDGERAALWAGRLGAPVTGDPGEAAALADAVIVMSETSRHAELAAAATAAGKDLFIEKPLGRSAAEAEAIRAAIERAGVRFHTGYLLREVDGHQHIRELVREGALGTIVRARGLFAHPGALAGWFEDYPWTTDPAAAGFGGFGDEGVHVIDLLCWTLGQSITTGTADIVRVTPNARIDEHGEALVHFDGGAVATIGAGWTEPVQLTEIVVMGTKGYARVTNGELQVDAPERQEQRASSAPASRLAVGRFLAAVTDGSDEPLVSSREAAEHCRVLEALYRAASADTWVSLGQQGARAAS